MRIDGSTDALQGATSDLQPETDWKIKMNDEPVDIEALEEALKDEPKVWSMGFDDKAPHRVSHDYVDGDFRKIEYIDTTREFYTVGGG